MKFNTLTCVALTMLSLVIACTSQRTVPDRTERLLNAELSDIIETYGFPGMTATIIRDEDVWSGAVGFANRETELRMTPDTRMLAASVGKTFVAATVLKLDQQQALDIDDSISNWIGDRTWFDRLPNSELITVRQLLQHTSGLPDHVHLPAFSELGLDLAARIGPEGLIALILEEDALFAPGDGWSYTDTGYLLLGLIIEEVADQAYYDIVETEFLEPLRLDNTGPSNRFNIDRLARGYVSPASGLGLPQFTTDDVGNMMWNPSVEWTGGGFYSTSEDLARWGHNYLTGGLLGDEVLSEMTHGIAASGADPTSFYGLGLSLRLDAAYGPTHGHRGWIPGYVSSLQYYAEQNLVVAFQINTDIGIIDAKTNVILDVEERLVRFAEHG